MIPHQVDRAAQSKRAKAGSRSEDVAADLHEACRRAGVARLQKNGTPHVVLGPGGGGTLRIRYVDKAPIDFTGHMVDGGRSVGVEVKHVGVRKGVNGPLPPRFSLLELEPHQREALGDLDRAGGLAIVLVVYQGSAFAVPWERVANAIAFDAKSLDSEELEAHRVTDHAYLRRWAR